MKKISGTEHSIKLVRDEVIAQKGFNFTVKILENTKKEIRDLLAKSIIRKSSSFYSGPAFSIFKKNGRIRLVVDYRRLNAITAMIEYPIPHIQDFLIQLNGSKVFS